MTEQASASSPADSLLVSEYANILNEARVRLLGINSILSGTSQLPTWLTAELGYLQLRFLCELVAIGCVLAHGDIEATRGNKFRKTYEADHLIKQLDSLHPDFYPHPIRTTNTQGTLHIEAIESGFLSKEELIELYRECGNHLHRGNIHRIYHRSEPKRPPEIDRMLDWGKRFSILLSQHRIASINGRKQLICFLSHEQTEGNSLVVVAESPDADVA